MQIENEKSNRTKKKKGKFLWLFFALLFFGVIVYLSSFIDNFLKNYTLKEILFSSSKADNISSKVTESQSDSTEELSTNLLKNPLLLPCRVEGNKLFIKEPFKVEEFNVTDALFTLGKHGTTLYSTDFQSPGNNSLFCKGTMKVGSKKFFIYFCESRHAVE